MLALQYVLIHMPFMIVMSLVDTKYTDTDTAVKNTNYYKTS